MPRYVIKNEDGSQKVMSDNSAIAAHVLAFAPINGALQGDMVVETRAPGSKVFETVSGSPVKLNWPKTLTFTFAVAEYKFTITGSSNASDVEVTDTIKEL